MASIAARIGTNWCISFIFAPFFLPTFQRTSV
jgi:hypothetical protein